MTRDDNAARERVAAALDANLLVEASAGSGKTTALVKRMLALISSGVRVENIAAVTFTRRAADELRERFQNALETAFRAALANGDNVARYETALRDLPRAFTGTIHAFCARLLRERPIDIGLDPRFVEVTEAEWEEYKESFWNGWLEDVSIGEDATLAALYEVGIEPRSLAEAFSQYVEYSDVRFESTEAPSPDIADCRRSLEALIQIAWHMMPKQEPADGWDALMDTVWKLRASQRGTDWSDRVAFCRALTLASAGKCKVTQNRWGADKATKAAAKGLSESFQDWVATHAEPTLRQWREHRYPIVMRFLDRAASAFVRERHDAGRLGFTDLLLLSAKLLRENPAAREELGHRYSRLLVDEFQDTDPIQAEVCLLLSSEPSQGNDWRTVVPRAGGLFVVGDPKQSIYRFRRADIETYNVVRNRFGTFGEVLTLNRNFRSTKPIETFVNAHFSSALPHEATASQAAFSPMVTDKSPGTGDGVFRYTIAPSENKNETMFAEDAAMLATWVHRRITNGERKAGDFLILTQTRAPLEAYARALGEREIAVDVGGAELLQEYELNELLIVLRVLADPDNGVAVAAALEGLFFGLSPADLFKARQLGHSFSLATRPCETESLAGRALAVLHEWWTLSRCHPADVVVDRILDETGLLAYAAGEPIGESRAGALIRLVDELRASAGWSALTMSATVARIEALLRQESDDTPLRPGRTDAVRLMNVHRAKGLEADVVILAAPAKSKIYDPDLHVRRDAQGEALGWLQITNATSAYSTDVIAQPPSWEDMCATELQFVEAERLRLLYVASTRARHELVVARATTGKKYDESQWSKLSATLDAQAKNLELDIVIPAERSTPSRTRDDVREAIEAAELRIRDASVPTTRSTTVTRSVKADEQMVAEYDLPKERGLGAAWGRAVHLSIEAMGRGLSGDDLANWVHNVASVEEVDADHLLAALERVRQLPEWSQMTEFELPVMRVTTDPDGTEVVTEGVIDAVAHDENGWVVIDWKTDIVEGDEWNRRLGIYEKQVDAYVQTLAALTGERASGRIERVRE